MAGNFEDLIQRFHLQPYFFEGQALTSDHLNRLASFAADRVALPLGLLCGRGGILRQVGEELRAIPAMAEGLELKILPGAAISSSGYLYHLREPVVLDLRSIAPLTVEDPSLSREVYVYLVSREELSDKKQDPEYSEIEGFETKVLAFDIIASDRILSNLNSIEICRLHLTPETKSLEKLNLGHRKYVSLLSGRQLTADERSELISGIRKIRGILLHVTDAFQVPQPAGIPSVLISIDAELRRDNLEERALSGLLDEALESLAALLEDVRSVVGLQATSQDERLSLVEATLDQVAALRRASSDGVEGLRKTFALVETIDQKLLGMSELKIKILHALSVIRHKAYVRSQTIAPAGRVFHLRDHIEAEDVGRKIEVVSSKQEKVSITSQGAVRSGEVIEALAVTGGQLQVRPVHLLAGKDLLILGRTYKRRRPVSVTYEWNGSVVHKEKAGDGDPDHEISLFGFIVPGSFVTSSENQLRVTIDSYEIHYPFLGLSFYQ